MYDHRAIYYRDAVVFFQVGGGGSLSYIDGIDNLLATFLVLNASGTKCEVIIIIRIFNKCYVIFKIIPLYLSPSSFPFCYLQHPRLRTCLRVSCVKTRVCVCVGVSSFYHNTAHYVCKSSVWCAFLVPGKTGNHHQRQMLDRRRHTARRMRCRVLPPRPNHEGL